MKKWNKKLFFITTLVIFIPMIAGFLMWDRLPDRLITHWNAAGEPDGTMGKLSAILIIPGFIFLMHLFCLFMTHLDAKNAAQSPKALAVAYWAMPVTALFSGGMLLGGTLVDQLQVLSYVNFLLGAFFLIAGNYMPKFRPNGSLGIRLPWTLKSEDNWRKTHRFGSRIFLIGGAVMMAGTFLGNQLQAAILLTVLAFMLITTGVYSYKLSKKEQQ